MHDVTGTFGPHPWWAAPFFFLVSTYGRLGWLIIALAVIGTIAVLSRVVDGLAWLLDFYFRRFRRGTIRAAADGRNVLRAVVRGASIPELESAALDRARSLYGLDANLAVAAVENVATSPNGDGLATATVYVQRLPAAGRVSAQEAGTS